MFATCKRPASRRRAGHASYGSAIMLSYAITGESKTNQDDIRDPTLKQTFPATPLSKCWIKFNWRVSNVAKWGVSKMFIVYYYLAASVRIFLNYRAPRTKQRNKQSAEANKRCPCVLNSYLCDQCRLILLFAVLYKVVISLKLWHNICANKMPFSLFLFKSK